VKRDQAAVRAAVGRVESDLRRTLDPAWSCALDDDWVLTVNDGMRTEVSGLAGDVEDESWYFESDQTPSERAAAQAAEADELVATEVAEILRVLGVGWPVCPQHARLMSNCEGWWLCSGPPSHDVATAGTLGQA